MTKETKKTGLELLREPFLPNQISKLPKPTKAQTDEVKSDFSKGIRCTLCGAWHHPKVVHLDYVGHAALTDRLLDADPNWNWKPVQINNGLPVFDNHGGMWIELTVCGVTRLGYGDAQGKTGGDAMKEIIGDALRNAAMRFGAALDLWHKGDLHVVDSSDKTQSDIKPIAPLNSKVAEYINTVQLNTISELIHLTSSDLKSFLKHFKVESLDKIHSHQYEAVEKALSLKLDQINAKKEV